MYSRYNIFLFSQIAILPLLFVCFSSLPYLSSFPLLPVHGLLARFDDVVDLRDGRLLQIERVWHGNVRSAYPLDWGVEGVEDDVVLHAHGGDLGADAALGPTVLDRHDAAGLLDGGEDRVPVEGSDGPEVDDLRIDPLGRELLRSLQRKSHPPAERDDGDVASLLRVVGWSCEWLE